MERMISHEEVQDLLGAYALDAVDADEKELIEYHLDRCPRCRDELRNQREVVGLLAYAGEEAPTGLWDRVVERLNDAGPDVTTPTLRPVPGDQTPGRPSWRAARGLMAVAAAAVVLIALLGVQVVRLQHRTNHLSSQVAALVNGPQPTVAAVQRALGEPGAQLIELRPTAGGTAAIDAVILPSGAGYLYESHLAPLPPAQTYQLWGIAGSQAISYGLIGSVPAEVTAFRVGHGAHDLAVTAEEAGGVVSPTQTPLVVGPIK